MRIRPLLRIIGALLVCIGVCILAAAAVALLYREEDLFAHLMASGISLIAGLGLFFGMGKKPANLEISQREAFAVVTFGWFATCAAGALPFFLYAHLPKPLYPEAAVAAEIALPDCAADTGLGREFCSYTNALFESTSGFTTTGATVLTAGLWSSTDGRHGGLPHGLLFWRALTHFIGGMGIIVLGVAILPLLGVGGMQLFKAEVPGPVKDKMAPRIAETARLLWKVYAGMTILQFVALTAAGGGPFLAICHAFATMATGGFSPLAASVEGLHNPASEWIILIFMFLAGANFSLHFLSLKKRRPVHWGDHEFRFYAAITLLAAGILTVVLIGQHDHTAHDGVRSAVFQVLTIMTTTGFSTEDFALWGFGAQMVLFALFFVGGCAGSTGGGIKCVRVFLMTRVALKELRRLVHPHGVIQTKLSGRVVGDNIIHSVAGFCILYLSIYIISALIFGLAGYDLSISLTAVGANLGNIGPGLGPVGPAGNYEFFASPLKWLLTFDMIAGRLELYSVLIILTPEFWRK